MTGRIALHEESAAILEQTDNRRMTGRWPPGSIEEVDTANTPTGASAKAGACV